MLELRNIPVQNRVFVVGAINFLMRAYEDKFKHLIVMDVSANHDPYKEVTRFTVSGLKYITNDVLLGFMAECGPFSKTFICSKHDIQLRTIIQGDGKYIPTEKSHISIQAEVDFSSVSNNLSGKLLTDDLSKVEKLLPKIFRMNAVSQALKVTLHPKYFSTDVQDEHQFVLGVDGCSAIDGRELCESMKQEESVVEFRIERSDTALPNGPHWTQYMLILITIQLKTSAREYNAHKKAVPTRITVEDKKKAGSGDGTHTNSSIFKRVANMIGFNVNKKRRV